jgi:hypothetical protein
VVISPETLTPLEVNGLSGVSLFGQVSPAELVREYRDTALQREAIHSIITDQAACSAWEDYFSRSHKYLNVIEIDDSEFDPSKWEGVS